MKINIIGGGPSGLYFGLLMKKADPRHDITIYERNAPDSTFGWGVVFSGKTLSNLLEADVESHDRIAASFALWDNVDVVHRAEKISVHGNRFSGIARIELLNILQERCRELGVELRFNEEASDVEALAAAADLLVGADGVNSAVRAHYADNFRPQIGFAKNRYIWYGTKQLFHGLTLTFRENANQVFAAHSYKFNQTTSTFIVECDEATWAAAGFEAMTEASTRAYLEKVFAPDLGGHELLSNNSKWINFTNVRNGRWHHGNVVLLGDALHTAHFSIGSGTKLALEDSIALFHACQDYAYVPKALSEFERARRPVIEDYQAAARDSLEWFEHARDYMHLTPYGLAYSLMTRSGKIDLDNLRRRDPQFIEAYERHQEGAAEPA
jgi:anthraniloyl-CoA monooxygenase